MKYIYLDMIVEGRLKFSEVPWLWEDEVRDFLIEEGYEDLINAN